METDAPHLRPLGIGEVLDVALKIVWRNAGTLFRIVFFIVFPVQVVSVLVQASAIPSEEDIQSGSTTFEGSDAAAAIGAISVAGILILLASMLASGACYRAVASAYLGERTGWKQSLAYALRRFHSILWVSLLWGVLFVIGFVLCFIPGIYLGVIFSLAIPALLTEDKRGTKALGRSRALVRGYWWRTFAVLLLGTILIWIISAALGAVVGAAAASPSANDATSIVLQIAADTVSSVVSTPVIAAFITVLYFDLRVRKEAYDLQLLAERIGVEPPGGIRGPRDDRPEIPGAEQPPFWPPPPGWKPGGADGS